MTAVLIVSAICLGEVDWILGPVRLEQERMISRKRTMIKSLSFVVLLLVFGSGAGANSSTTTKQEETSFHASVSLPKKTSVLSVVFIASRMVSAERFPAADS